MPANKRTSDARDGASDGHEVADELRVKEKAHGTSAALQRLFSDADTYLKNSPLAQRAASCTGIRPSVLCFGLGLFMLISLGTGLGGGLVCDIAGFLYPAWMSFRAIESPGTEDDKLWLTYWVVYGAFSIVEYFVDFILFWVPFYYLLKFCFLLYLGLPCFKGAEVVYNVVIRPFLLKHQEPIDAYVDKLGNAGSKAAENLQQAVHDGFSMVHQAVGAARHQQTHRQTTDKTSPVQQQTPENASEDEGI